jgi:hypothetical protein
MSVFADIRITLEDGDDAPVLGLIAFVRWATRHPAAAEALLGAVEGAYKACSRDLAGFDDALRQGHAAAYEDLVAAPGAGDGVAFLGTLHAISLRLDEVRKAPATKVRLAPVVHARHRRDPKRTTGGRRHEPRMGRIQA